MENSAHDEIDTKGGWIVGGGLLSALGGLLGASCCILPILLVNAGVSSALVGNLAFFAQARPFFLAATAVLVGLGLFFAFRSGRPSRRVAVILSCSVIIAVVAYVMPWFEGDLLRWATN